jgi:hypothetical protein
MGTLHENVGTFTTTSPSILLRMRNFSDKILWRKSKQILRSITFFPKNHAFYEIMWKNKAQPVNLQMTI